MTCAHRLILSLIMFASACGDDTISQPAPTQGTEAEALSGAVGLFTSSQTTCARVEGATAMCWGSDLKGALGDGDGSPGAGARAIDVRDMVSFDGGLFTSIALDERGKLYGWGELKDGSLGPVEELRGEVKGELGTNVFQDGLYITSPSPLFTARTFSAISYEGYTGCVLDGASAPFCFGQRFFQAQFEEDANDGGLFPLLDAEGEERVSADAIASTSSSVCVVRENTGSVWCMGAGADGELGRAYDAAGSFTECEPGITPSATRFCQAGLKPTAPELSSISQLEGVGGGYCALGEESLRCWGRNRGDRFDQDGALALSSPTLVKAPVARVAHVALGEEFLCVSGENREVHCRGERMGDRGAWVKVLDDADHLVAGARHACAIVGEDKNVVCWGNNDATQLGAARIEDLIAVDDRQEPETVLRASE